MDIQSSSNPTPSTESLKSLLQGMNEEMQVCILNCIQCHQVCEQAIQFCLKKGGDHAHPQHIRILQDCTEICVLSANFMLRDSVFHGQTCAMCASICSQCATDCEQFSGDEMMQMCVEVCKRCSDSCAKMAVHH